MKLIERGNKGKIVVLGIAAVFAAISVAGAILSNKLAKEDADKAIEEEDLYISKDTHADEDLADEDYSKENDDACDEADIGLCTIEGTHQWVVAEQFKKDEIAASEDTHVCEDLVDEDDTDKNDASCTENICLHGCSGGYPPLDNDCTIEVRRNRC